MKTLKTEILINATPEQVWKILMDFTAYSEWNPFIRSIEGKAAVGTKLNNVLEIEGRKPMSISPKVLKVEANQEFRWKGKMFIPGLFDGEHYFKLEDAGGGKTKFIHGENFSGMLVGMVWKSIGEATQKGFVAMNESLKARAEG